MKKELYGLGYGHTKPAKNFMGKSTFFAWGRTRLTRPSIFHQYHHTYIIITPRCYYTRCVLLTWSLIKIWLCYWRNFGLGTCSLRCDKNELWTWTLRVATQIFICKCRTFLGLFKDFFIFSRTISEKIKQF